MMMLQRHSRFSTRVVVVMAAVALFLAAVFVAPSQAGPLTTFIVGGSYFIPQPNPWNLQAYRYNPRRVLPGNDLVFRWNGWRSDVWKFPTFAAYQSCDFSVGVQLTKPSYFGRYIYSISKAEAGTTLYFGSRVWLNCRKGQKAKIRVRDLNPFD